MLRPCLAVCLAAVLVCGAGGCANDDVAEANAYVAAVNQAQERFSADSARLIVEVAPEDPAGAKRVVLTRLYGVAGDFVAQLRTIEPPADVTALHERLVSAGVRFEGRLRRAGAALTSDNAGRILDGQEELAAAAPRMSRSINATIAAINAELSG